MVKHPNLVEATIQNPLLEAAILKSRR